MFPLTNNEPVISTSDSLLITAPEPLQNEPLPGTSSKSILLSKEPESVSISINSEETDSLNKVKF